MSWKMLLGLTVVSLSIASAKTYHVTLSESYKVGSQMLAPGEYSVAVSGSNAVLAGPKSEQLRINGKVENENRKFDDTAIVSRDETGSPTLDSIQIGGTNMEVKFN